MMIEQDAFRSDRVVIPIWLWERVYYALLQMCGWYHPRKQLKGAAPEACPGHSFKMT